MSDGEQKKKMSKRQKLPANDNQPMRKRMSRRQLIASFGAAAGAGAFASLGLAHALEQAAGTAGKNEIELNQPVTHTDDIQHHYSAGHPQRPLSSKLREVISVTDFGAAGDGKTDDTKAIQAALKAGGKGRKIIFPAGRYVITDTIIIPGGTHISGENTQDAWDGQTLGTSIVTMGPGTPRKWTDIDDGDDSLITPALVFGGNEIVMENITVQCGAVRWDAGIFLPCVKRTTLINADTTGQWKKAGLYIDATWSDRNSALTSLHPEVIPSTGMNELHAENCYFRGLWGVLVQGTVRNPDDYSSSNWIWGWGGTSDLSFVNCRMGSTGPASERQQDGGCFKHDAAMKNAAKAGQGHNFVNCSFRTSSKYMIYLDRSNRDTFINCYGETISSWEHGPAVFAITSRTGEIGRLNDKINAPVMLDGEILFSSAGSVPYRPETKMSVHRTTGQLYTPNFSGFGESSSSPTEIISYFMHPGNDGRILFKHGTSIYADIDTGRFNLRDIPLMRANNGFNFDIRTNRKLSITPEENISYQALRPSEDGQHSLGTPSYRWSELHAASGAITTSDRNTKTAVSEIPDAWLDAWAEVNYCRYKHKDAVAKKGDGARWHVGVIAQDVYEAFARHGIDALEIGLICRDESKDVPGGTIWSIRADECQFLEMALMRRELERLKSRTSHVNE